MFSQGDVYVCSFIWIDFVDTKIVTCIFTVYEYMCKPCGSNVLFGDSICTLFFMCISFVVHKRSV